MKTRKGYLICRGKTYYAVWTVAGRKYMKTTGKTDKRDAQARLAEIMEPFLVEDEIKTLQNVATRIAGAKAELATIDEKNNPPLTLAKAWSVYETAPNRPDSGERTLNDYAGYFQAFVEWIQGTHKDILTLQDVTPKTAAEYAAHLNSRKLSAGTFNKHLNCLALVFRILLEPGRLTQNPWDKEGIQRKRQNGQGRRELTIDELKTICEKPTGEMRLLLALGIYTGLRLGDCCTLRWGEVDLHRGIIRRVPAKTARRNPKPVLVPLHPVLRGILGEIPAAVRHEYVLPKTAAAYLRDTSAPSKLIQDHFEACGVTVHKPGTGFKTETGEDGKEKEVHTGKRAIVEVGFHSLRHTFVSLCRESNAPLSVVESIVGHSNPAMTRHYTHTSEAAALAAVTALPSVMGADMPKALPAPAVDHLTAFKAEIRTLADQLNAKTWRTVKEELLLKATA